MLERSGKTVGLANSLGKCRAVILSIDEYTGSVEKVCHLDEMAAQCTCRSGQGNKNGRETLGRRQRSRKSPSRNDRLYRTRSCCEGQRQSEGLKRIVGICWNGHSDRFSLRPCGQRPGPCHLELFHAKPSISANRFRTAQRGGNETQNSMRHRGVLGESLGVAEPLHPGMGGQLSIWIVQDGSSMSGPALVMWRQWRPCRLLPWSVDRSRNLGRLGVRESASSRLEIYHSPKTMEGLGENLAETAHQVFMSS